MSHDEDNHPLQNVGVKSIGVPPVDSRPKALLEYTNDETVNEFGVDSETSSSFLFVRSQGVFLDAPSSINQFTIDGFASDFLLTEFTFLRRRCRCLLDVRRSLLPSDESELVHGHSGQLATLHLKIAHVF